MARGKQIVPSYSPSNYTPTPASPRSLESDLAGIDAALGAGGPQEFHQTFSLIESLSSSPRFFYAAQSQSPTDAQARSGNSFNPGYANNAKCSPFLMPRDGTIIRAVARLGNVGVNTGTVVYPVRYRAAVFRIDPVVNTLLGNADFLIPNANPVDTFSTGVLTDFRGALALSIPVLAGDLIALEFLPGSGGSQVALQECCYVTLTFQT